jgi:hypothetical protein
MNMWANVAKIPLVQAVNKPRDEKMFYILVQTQFFSCPNNVKLPTAIV